MYKTINSVLEKDSNLKKTNVESLGTEKAINEFNEHTLYKTAKKNSALVALSIICEELYCYGSNNSWFSTPEDERYTLAEKLEGIRDFRIRLDNEIRKKEGNGHREKKRQIHKAHNTRGHDDDYPYKN